MSNIRVTYSGLIALTIGLISVFTGIIFTLVITRRLSPEEFGTWAIIGNMISYFVISERMISYWCTRQIARGEEVGRTAIVSSFLISIGSIPLYLSLVYLLPQNSKYDSMVFGTILLPVYIISQTLYGINLSHRPHATSYSILFFETVKIPASLALVYFFNLSIKGAIMATTIAYLGKIVIQLYYGKPRLGGKFDISTLKNWIKLSWIPLYSTLSHIIWGFDVVVYSLITHSTIGVAYYAAAISISAIISNSGMISQALYPKLLAKGGHEYVKENLTRLMYFAIPLLGISVIFSKPALFALNPLYQGVSTIVIIMSFRTFFYVLTNTLYDVLTGIETIDLDKNIRYSVLAKSKLFKVPTMINIHYSLYLILMSIALFVLHSHGSSEIDLVSSWATVALVLQVLFFVIVWFYVKKYVQMSFPFVHTLKYIFASIGFIVVFFLTSNYIIQYKSSIYYFLPTLLIQLAICMAVYVSVTCLIDKKTRSMFKAIFEELIGKM